MLAIDVIDHRTGNHIETIHLCRNGNEDINYKGQIYVTTDFNIDTKSEIDRPSEASLSFFDRTGVIIRYMQMYRGGVGFKVKLFFLNTGNMNQPPEFAETFSVRTASADTGGYTVSFTLGMENPLAQRIPRRTQRKDRCQWRYKGPECKYTGSLAGCDYTLQGE
ncbi:hypothetical protein HSBAA_29690 [Vreelandella sulfidaeris]|uniref:Uncharacterized protein n=1 Tax=Vreelandella sulfidaeris TaxID=115553 RepID=A0A455U8V4_9GAMM|nr:hypothetical protein HSBAA_29690 [Halomonas sulfidaeris]